MADKGKAMPAKGGAAKGGAMKPGNPAKPTPGPKVDKSGGKKK